MKSRMEGSSCDCKKKYDVDADDGNEGSRRRGF